MDILLMCLLGFAVTWGVVDAVRNDDDDSAPEPERPDPDEVLIAESSSILNAGGGNDTIIADDDGNGVSNTTIHGGGGDDTITLVGVTYSLIEGGPGNDTIEGSADNSNVFGGLHDDVIDVNGNQSHISGGLGDDTIIAGGGYSNFHGDRGDDVIDARNMWASKAYGGRGDDLVILAPQPVEVTNSAYGGTGDDTLRAYTEHGLESGTNSLYGGAGADRFEVILQHYSNGANSVPGYDWPLVTIADFMPGVDVLNLQLPGLPTDSAPQIGLVESEDGSGTAVTISYLVTSENADGSSTETPAQAYVWLPGATGLALADIEVQLEEAPPPVDPEPGQHYEVQSGDRITGGAGNDQFTGRSLENVNIIAGPGDDTVDLTGSDIQVRGGEGNDTIHIGGERLIAHGGGGDDWLYLHDAGQTHAYGGDGNDLFTASFGDQGGGSLQGGEGDDNFNLTLTSHDWDEINVQPALLYGGEGADLYEVNVYAETNNEGGALPEPPRPLAVIADFVQGEDRVIVEPRLNDGSADEPTFTGMVFRGDLIVLQYAVPPTTPGDEPTLQEEWIRLTGVTQITAADVSLAAPAA